MQIKALSSIKKWTSKYTENITINRLLTVLSMDILVRLSNIILLPVYLKLMSQEEYGLYNYILSIIATFSVVLNFGLYVSQAKYYADSEGSHGKGKVLFNILGILSILLTIIIIPIYAFKVDYLLVKLLFKNDIHYSSFRLPMLLAVLASVYMVILVNFLVVTERIKLYRKYNMYRLIIINILVLSCMYYLGGDKIHIRLLYTYIAELVVMLVFAFLFYFRDMQPIWDKKLIVSSLRLGLPVMFSSIWGVISNYSDKFFLEKYGTARDLSYYYLAFSIANILYMVCTAAQSAWMPLFLKERDLKVNIKQSRRFLVRLAAGLLGLGILLLTGLYIAIKTEVISDKYTPALYVLPFLLLGQTINGVVLLYSNFMIYFEKTHWSFFIGILASLVSLAGGYWLIPIWGVVGAVIIYLLVQITYLLLNHFMIQYKIKKMLAAG